MVRLGKRSVLLLCILTADAAAHGQKPPLTPDHPWNVPAQNAQIHAQLAPVFRPDPSKIYALSDLVDIAEQNNPATRVAWENAKSHAADLGIAKAALYPTLAAAALAQSSRVNIFFSPAYYRQTTETFSPVFVLDYLIFDFGQRSQQIDVSKNSLWAANFQFNDTHRNVIFAVMQAYYRLLDARGQRAAKEANLKNAQTVQQASEARLQLGLATLPDVLETRSATAQADYDLQASIGAAEIAYGDLAMALGVSPASEFQVQGIEALKMPEQIADTIESSIDRALAQRPDLMQRVAELRATESEVKAAQRSYFPTLRIDGDAGLARTYGEQNQAPGLYSQTQETWTARLSLDWTLFDGWARENRIAQAKADRKQAVAEVETLRDQIENQVWSAYSTARTALREQRAAAALLASANESYNAAIEAYRYGVRSQIDVVSAQRTLAEARTADVSARAQLLTGMAALAYQTGDLLHAKGP